eukprot:gene7933-10766_t
MGLFSSKSSSNEPILGVSGAIARNIFDFSVESIINKEPVSLSKYSGKKVYLIVNVAGDNGKFQILAFPCNNFLFQESGSNDQIAQFANKKGATFPIFGKMECENGSSTHPLYKFLKSYPGLTPTGSLDWNFANFLCNSDGIPVKRYLSKVSPLALENDIVQMLNGPDSSTDNHDNAI